MLQEAVDTRTVKESAQAETARKKPSEIASTVTLHLILIIGAIFMVVPFVSEMDCDEDTLTVPLIVR